MKNILILLLFITSLNLHAQKFLVDEDEEETDTPAYSPDQARPFSPENEDTQQANIKMPTTLLQLRSIVGARSYELLASNNLGIDFSGIEYGLALSYFQKYSEVSSWALEIAQTTYSYKELGASVTPNELTGKSTNIRLTHENRIWSSSFMNTYIRFSYLFNQDKNDTTTPLQITDQTYHSFGVGLSFEKTFSNQKILSLSTSFHPSFKYKESPLSSGTLESSNLYQWSLQYRFPIATNWHLSVGHRGSMQNIEFSGAGQRSLPFAKITNTQLSGTIGVSYAL